MNDNIDMILSIRLQLRSREIQFAERRLAVELARLEERAASDRFEATGAAAPQLQRGLDRRPERSWWRYY